MLIKRSVLQSLLFLEHISSASYVSQRAYLVFPFPFRLLLLASSVACTNPNAMQRTRCCAIYLAVYFAFERGFTLQARHHSDSAVQGNR